MLVCLFPCVIHDAVHGTIFKNKEANRLLVHSFDLMGANSFIWQVRHVRFHHNYPNVQGSDTDIEQSKIFRVFPHSEVSPFHRYQHLYLPLLYDIGIYSRVILPLHNDEGQIIGSLNIVREGEY